MEFNLNSGKLTAAGDLTAQALSVVQVEMVQMMIEQVEDGTATACPGCRGAGQAAIQIMGVSSAPACSVLLCSAGSARASRLCPGIKSGHTCREGGAREPSKSGLAGVLPERR